jgi:glycosyltransferase involved in cell wall biosynthesis
MSPSIEVVLATYNNAGAMRLVLEGYCRQTFRDFSLAVADDGSKPEIAGLVREFSKRGLRIRHRWHEDIGYRRALAMNGCIQTSQADLLVLTDNDCIPHRRFVADHRVWARRGWMSLGRRVDTGPEVAQELMDGRLDPIAMESIFWLTAQACRGRIGNAKSGLRLPGFLARLGRKRARAALGANMGIWKDDLLAVGGFDERFTSYGGEEVDLERRLMGQRGLRQSAMRFHGILFHVWHPTRSAAVSPQPA